MNPSNYQQIHEIKKDVLISLSFMSCGLKIFKKETNLTALNELKRNDKDLS